MFNVNAIELIRMVYANGGRLTFEDEHLIVEASSPLPEDLLETLAAEKPAVMIALGAPLDVAVSEILEELRPNLPAVLRDLPDAKILALVNWSIMEAWFKTLQRMEGHVG